MLPRFFFLLLDHLAPGAAVRSELLAALNAACGPLPLSSLLPPPSSSPLSTELLPLPRHAADLPPSHSFLPLPTPPPSDLHLPLLSMSSRKFASASLAPLGGHCAMWPRRTPAHAARPRGAARSRIPLWRPPHISLPVRGLESKPSFPTPHESPRCVRRRLPYASTEDS